MGDWVTILSDRSCEFLMSREMVDMIFPPTFHCRAYNAAPNLRLENPDNTYQPRMNMILSSSITLVR